MLATQSNEDTMEKDEDQYEILSKDEISKNMEKIIENVSSKTSVTNYSTTSLRIKLNQFGWDQQKTMELFLPHNNIQNEDVLLSQIDSSKLMNAEKIHNLKCNICFENFPEGQDLLMGLKCNHVCCHSCWTTYIKTKINTDQANMITCPGSSCQIIVEDDSIFELIDDDLDTKIKYQEQRSPMWILLRM